MHRLDTDARPRQDQGGRGQGPTRRKLTRAALTLLALVALLGVGGQAAAAAAAPPANKPVRLQLVRIVCHETEDWTWDTAYLQVFGQTIWEDDMDAEESQELGGVAPLKFRQSISVSLYDADWPDPDDHLGTVTIRRNQLGKGVRQATFDLDDAHYTLYYRVVR